MKVWLLLLSLACVACAAPADPHKPVRGVFQVSMLYTDQYGCVASQHHPGSSSSSKTPSWQAWVCAASHTLQGYP